MGGAIDPSSQVVAGRHSGAGMASLSGKPLLSGTGGPPGGGVSKPLGAFVVISGVVRMDLDLEDRGVVPVYLGAGGVGGLITTLLGGIGEQE